MSNVAANSLYDDVSVSFLEEGHPPPNVAPDGTIVDAFDVSNNDNKNNQEGPALPTKDASHHPQSQALPSQVPPPPTLADYLTQHNLAPVFDRMFQECSKRLQQNQQQTSSSSAAGGHNPVCDGMLDVVSDILFQRSALSTRPCVPPDAINHSPSAATVHHVRNTFGGKRVLVVLELPATLPHLPQGPNSAEETGPAVLAWYRLELMCRTIVAIASLASGSHSMTGKFSPRVVVGIVLTPTPQEEDAEAARRGVTTGGKFATHGGGRRAMPTVSAAPGDSGGDDDDDDAAMMALSDFDDIDDSATTPPAGGGDQQKHRRATSSGAAGGPDSMENSSFSSVPAPPDSALYALAALLQGEGVDTEFLASHTALLGGNNDNAGGNSPDQDAHPNNGSDDEGGIGAGGQTPIQVRFLPPVWAPSEASSNPLSAFDPVLAFADVVVIEGLETMRLHHPLLTFVPKSIGTTMLGVGAALELCALRALMACGSISRRKIEFPAPAIAAGGAGGNPRMHKQNQQQQGGHNVVSAKLSSVAIQRILIVGDDEEHGGASTRTLTSRSPLLLPSALEHLVAMPGALEAIVYQYDKIYLVGSASLIWQRVVNKRRRYAEEEGGAIAELLTTVDDNNGPSAVDSSSPTAKRRQPRQEFSLMEWASRTEAAVCALLDAVEYFSPTIPGGCQVIPATDFVIVKKTTSGKSKVDVITRQAYESTDYFQTFGQSCPPKFYYADIGPATRADIVTSIQSKASFVAAFGSLTRCAHHVGGTRAAPTAFSAQLPDEETERKVMTSTSAASILMACRSGGGGADSSAVPLVLFGEHWAQSLAANPHSSTASSVLPIPTPQVIHYQTPPPPQALVALHHAGNSTSTAGGGTTTPRGGRFQKHGSLSSVPSSLAPHALLLSNSMLQQLPSSPSPSGGGGHASPNIRSSSVTDSMSPGGTGGGGGARRRQSVARSPRSTIQHPSAHPRPRAQSVCHLTSQRLVRKDASLQDEVAVVHLSTMPYRQVARLLGGDCWESLKELPCSVPTRTTVHRW